MPVLGWHSLLLLAMLAVEDPPCTPVMAAEAVQGSSEALQGSLDSGSRLITPLSQHAAAAAGWEQHHIRFMLEAFEQARWQPLSN
jgi:hypothetical protein